MDESGNHHSQQTDTRTENQTLHVLIHRWVLNNENIWTQGGEYHTPGPVGEWGVGSGEWGARGGISGGWEFKGGIALEEIPNVDNGLMDAANHHGTCIAM